MTLVADAFGANRIPSACSTRQVPTVRRSCQPMPGATGFPVARSHTMLDARWLAIPTPATGPPFGAWHGQSPKWHRPCVWRRTRPDRGPANPATRGRGARARRWRQAVRWQRGHPMSRRRRRECSPRRRSCPGRRSERRGETELSGVEDAVGVEGRLEAAEYLESGAQRPGQESGAIEADAMVMAIAAPWAKVASVTVSHAWR